MHLKLAVLAVTLAIATCGPGADTSADGGTHRDGGAPIVIVPLPDAGTEDAGSGDAGTDAGTPDAGTPDAGTPDAGDPYTFEVLCRVGYGYNFTAHYQLDAGECGAGLLYAYWSDGGVRPLISTYRIGGLLVADQGSDDFPWDTITFDVGPCTTPAGGYPDPPPMPNPWRTRTISPVKCE